MEKKKEKRNLVVHPANFLIGAVIAAIYLVLLLLIPSQVSVTKMAMTNPRIYPYIVFSVTSALAVAFGFAYRKVRYEINFGIWPLVLGTVLFYLGMLSIGFYLSAFLMILYNAYFWRYTKKWVVLIIAVATPIVCYVFFTLCMHIHLPSGILF